MEYVVEFANEASDAVSVWVNENVVENIKRLFELIYKGVNGIIVEAVGWVLSEVASISWWVFKKASGLLFDWLNPFN